MKTIILISCVSKKIPYAAKAEELYISTLFTLAISYAKSLNPDAIYILSAKYGLVESAQVIEPYDLTLNDMATVEIERWAEKVLSQLKRVSDLNNDRFIFLAGDRYRKFLIPHISTYEIPLEGLRIGEQLSWLKGELSK